MRMMSKILFAAAMLSLALTVSAGAADLCVRDDFGNLFVAKSLSLPTADNCNTVNGFFAGTKDPISGNVCKTHNNAEYYFNLHYSVDNGYGGTGAAPFYLAAGTLVGSGYYLRPDYGYGVGFTTYFTIRAETWSSILHFGS